MFALVGLERVSPCNHTRGSKTHFIPISVLDPALLLVTRRREENSRNEVHKSCRNVTIDKTVRNYNEKNGMESSTISKMYNFVCFTSSKILEIYLAHSGLTYQSSED